jgi:hypothetical protein
MTKAPIVSPLLIYDAAVRWAAHEGMRLATQDEMDAMTESARVFKLAGRAYAELFWCGDKTEQEDLFGMAYTYNPTSQFRGALCRTTSLRAIAVPL